MPKLQRIEKPNGSVTFTIMIPSEEIEKLGWNKGDSLAVVSDLTDPDMPKIVIAKED